MTRSSHRIRSAAYPFFCGRTCRPFFDSDVICAYLATLHGGRRLIPLDGESRWHALRLQAVAQGLAESGIAVRWETVRRPPALRCAALSDGYADKLLMAYNRLEQELDIDQPVHIGHIAIATCLSWIAFRKLPSFREGRPKLARWFDEFEKRPSMRATPLSGDTVD